VDIEIREFDPADETALRAWWEVGRAATAERPGTPWPEWAQSRRALPAPNPERRTTMLLACAGGAPVGASMLMEYLRENQHAVGIDVYVVPEHRRRGVGTALLADLESRAVAAGRPTVLCEAFVPPGGRGPAAEFARARGYVLASRESIKELDAEAYRARRAGLAATLRHEDAGYRLVTFDTVCPEEHVASFGRLLGTLMAEIPMGELDLRDSEWTPERVRAFEQRQASIGRHVVTALAIAPDGSVAGSSDVRVNEVAPTHGEVGITLVDPAHRGHRLGLALKLATHDLALATWSGCRSFTTSNADVNTHMNAVNEAMGYRPLETLLELQKRL
jgi:GNAT superfamily N-acetyltransferase